MVKCRFKGYPFANSRSFLVGKINALVEFQKVHQIVLESSRYSIKPGKKNFSPESSIFSPLAHCL